LGGGPRGRAWVVRAPPGLPQRVATRPRPRWRFSMRAAHRALVRSCLAASARPLTRPSPSLNRNQARQRRRRLSSDRRRGRATAAPPPPPPPRPPPRPMILPRDLLTPQRRPLHPSRRSRCRQRRRRWQLLRQWLVRLRWRKHHPHHGNQPNRVGAVRVLAPVIRLLLLLLVMPPPPMAPMHCLPPRKRLLPLGTRRPLRSTSMWSMCPELHRIPATPLHVTSPR